MRPLGCRLAACWLLVWPLAALAEAEQKKPAPAPKKTPEHPVAALLAGLLDSTPLPKDRTRRLLAMGNAAYQRSKHSPIWAGFEPEPLETRFSAILEHHALADAKIPAFDRVPKDLPREAGAISLRDAIFTLQAAEACLLVKTGIAAKTALWPHWRQSDRPGSFEPEDYTAALAKKFAQAVTKYAPEPEKIVARFAPRNWIYRRLLAARDRSGKIPEKLAKLELELDDTISAGEEFAKARQLGRFLQAQGFLPRAELKTIGQTYSEGLAGAMRSYQRVNGLGPDGVLGPKTAGSIAKGSKPLTPLLERNLHRARLLPDNPGERYLIANLPAGEVYGYDKTQKTAQMRIVFGRNTHDRRTPIFRNTMTTVVFRPYWWVPKSIAAKEYLPRIRRDYSYVRRNGYQIVNGSHTVMSVTSRNLDRLERGALFLRQRSVSSNSLGKVKFLFPNEHHVYFHDTPAKSLFRENHRAYSHGCVRLQHPEDMANWVLNGEEDWTQKSIHSAMYSTTKRREVTLTKPIEVYIVYFTAFPAVDQKDGVGVYRDVYGRDKT